LPFNARLRVMNAYLKRLAVFLTAGAMLSGCVSPTDDALRPAVLRSVWLNGAAPVSAATTSVYFATDRLAATDGGFTGGWNPGLTCGEAAVSLPSDREPGANWGPWRTEAAPASFTHATLASPIQSQDCSDHGERLAAAAEIENAAAAAHCDSVLIYIHGFNTTFPTALFTAAQFAHDTRYPCIVSTFSWASDGLVNRYIEDSEEADLAAPELLQFLRALGTSDKLKRIDVVAHSVGARVVLATIGELGRVIMLPRHPLINELVLAAPDVETAVFASLIERARPLVGRITVYVSKGDAALAASRSTHGGVARAGSVPDDLKTIPGIETIDASNANGGFYGHSYFSESTDAMTDIAAALRDVPLAARASDRPPGLKCQAGTSACMLWVSEVRKPSLLSNFVRWMSR
jgi:esterase/lipase superfamily enzyme